MQYYNERVERMSRDEKHALQSERLKKVVKLAYEQCKKSLNWLTNNASLIAKR